MGKSHSTKDPLTRTSYKVAPKIVPEPEILHLHKMYKDNLQVAFENVLRAKGYKNITSYFRTVSVQLCWIQTFFNAQDPLKRDSSKSYTLTFCRRQSSLMVYLANSSRFSGCSKVVSQPYSKSILYTSPENFQNIKDDIMGWLERAPNPEVYLRLKR